MEEYKETEIEKLTSLFLHSADLDEGVISCDVVDIVRNGIVNGNEVLLKNVIDIVKDCQEDWNTRGSALETLAAALIPDRTVVLLPILNQIMRDSREDPNLHHTALAIYGDLDEGSKDLLKPAVFIQEDYCDHRGKLARELLQCYKDFDESMEE